MTQPRQKSRKPCRNAATASIPYDEITDPAQEQIIILRAWCACECRCVFIEVHITAQPDRTYNYFYATRMDPSWVIGGTGRFEYV